MSAPRIHVHIGRLRLAGFAPEQQAGIAAGLQQALQALLSAPEAAAGLGGERAIGSLRADAIRTDANTTPAVLGAEAAQAIVQGIRR